MQERLLDQKVEQHIFTIRGQKVMLDKELAELYGVSTTNFNRATSRNLERFPKDFMFRLTKKEFENLIFHFGTSSWGGTRKLPRVFTEQGVAMLSGILRSRRAVQVNIAIMRVFIKLRQIALTHKELIYKLMELEQKVGRHDKEIRIVFETIKQLMNVPEKPKLPMGFH